MQLSAPVSIQSVAPVKVKSHSAIDSRAARRTQSGTLLVQWLGMAAEGRRSVRGCERLARAARGAGARAAPLTLSYIPKIRRTIGSCAVDQTNGDVG
jgi:hypothetical protein